MHSVAWRYGTTSGFKLEGHLKCLGADMQQPTECRKDEGTRVRRVAPKLIANGESRRPSRERQPSSGSQQDWAVTWQWSARGWRRGRRTGRRRRATAERQAKKTTVVRAKGRRMCAPSGVRSGDAGVEPAMPNGVKHLSGLDRFRVRRRCGVRVQRSHRRTLSTKSDGARDEPGSRARDEPTRWRSRPAQPWQTRFSSTAIARALDEESFGV